MGWLAHVHLGKRVEGPDLEPQGGFEVDPVLCHGFRLADEVEAQEASVAAGPVWPEVEVVVAGADLQEVVHEGHKIIGGFVGEAIWKEDFYPP